MIIEEIVRNFLDNTLDVPALMERRNDAPRSYVMVEKTGGGKENHLCSATIAVQSYGGSMYEASALNEQVKAAMEDIVRLDSISGAHLQTDYNFTDTSRGEYRYQAVFLLSHY